MEQNIRIKHRLNEVNHDYDVLKRRAILRRANRLRKADKLKQKHEAEIHRTIGIEAYSYMAKQRARQRRDNIEGAVIAIGLFFIIYSILFYIVI